MQGQMSWNPPASIPVKQGVARGNGFVSPPNIGPYSYPQSARSAPTNIRPQPSTWQTLTYSNEDYGNLRSQGFGSSWQSENPTHSHHSSECCSPPGPEAGWISPMEEQPVYLSPSWLQESSNPAYPPLPTYSVPSQVSNSDSEDDTVCAQSPSSVSYMIPVSTSTYAGPVGFEMELDDPSTADMDEDVEEETTIDESDAFEESTSEELDTTIDYSYLRGAIESPHGLEAYPVTLNASKTPCLDALAFCVVMRLGAYQTPQNEEDCSITITNFQKFLGGIHQFCPKKSQTDNEEARIKALKRWFDGIPTKRKRDSVFVMTIKDPKNPIVYQIIKKIQKFCISHGYARALNPATQQALRPMGY